MLEELLDQQKMGVLQTSLTEAMYTKWIIKFYLSQTRTLPTQARSQVGDMGF